MGNGKSDASRFVLNHFLFPISHFPFPISQLRAEHFGGAGVIRGHADIEEAPGAFQSEDALAALQREGKYIFLERYR